MVMINRFPHERHRIRRDMERLKKWIADYKRAPVKDDDEVFTRMGDLLAFVRLSMVDNLFLQTEVPAELRATQGIILDIMDYLPDRFARAMALDRFHPEMAAAIPKFPGWDNLGDGEDDAL